MYCMNVGNITFSISITHPKLPNGSESKNLLANASQV